MNTYVPNSVMKQQLALENVQYDQSESAGSASKTSKDDEDKPSSSKHELNGAGSGKSDQTSILQAEDNSSCQNSHEVSLLVQNSGANSANSVTSSSVSPHPTQPSSSFLQSSTSPHLEAPSNTSRSTFCRAPGLGPVTIPEGHSGAQHPLVCQICGFSCNSKFHYNSHMNTHGDHQCTMCDYTSRTEGRLKKHMRDSHTVEQQIAAGLEVDSSQRSVTPSLKKVVSHTLTTSVASLLEGTNLAVVQTIQNGGSPGTSPPSLTNSSPNSVEKCTSGTIIDDSSPNDSVVSLQREEPSTSGISGERRGGKPKNYKCKQCNQVSTSKEEQWVHARSHIPAEKRLECNRCGFVTEYKHHLEYHLRNHVGSKPFQCKKCAYSCVNKSMLNSHMKSHTNVYQFRCRDCSYATKYCHSLKLHLKKYNHNRAGDSNDGSGLDVSCGSIDGDDCEIRRLSESYSVNDDDDDSPSPQDNMQQGLSSTVSAPPVVTSSSLNLSQLLLQQQQQQSGQIDTVNALNAAFRMNALQSISTAGPVVSPQCHLCSYQPSSVDEGLRHQMMHIITGQNDLHTSVSAPSGIVSKETIKSNCVDGKCAEKISEEHENNVESGHPTTREDETELVSDDTDKSEKNSSDELSSSADENSEKSSRKRKAGLKLNEIATRLQEKKTPDVEESASESLFVSAEVKKERHNENTSNENVPNTVATGLPLLVPIPSLSGSRFLSPAFTGFLSPVGQAANNLSLLQQFANMQSQQFEEGLLEILTLWKSSCGHCKMDFQGPML